MHSSAKTHRRVRWRCGSAGSDRLVANFSQRPPGREEPDGAVAREALIEVQQRADGPLLVVVAVESRQVLVQVGAQNVGAAFGAVAAAQRAYAQASRARAAP